MVKFRRIPRDLPDDFTTVRVSPWKIPEIYMCRRLLIVWLVILVVVMILYLTGEMEDVVLW